MGRQAKHTPESVAKTICDALVKTENLSYSNLGVFEDEIVNVLRGIWPTRTPRTANKPKAATE